MNSSSIGDSSDLFKSLEAGDLLGDLKSLVELKDTQTADLDLPNILVAYSIPLPLDHLRQDYHKAQQNVHIWQAWEAARTEGLVQDQIKSRGLPSDSSYESKLKRTAYRVKVIQFLRESANWLITISDRRSDEIIKVHKPEASTAVLRVLSALLPDSFKEVDILLRPISRGIQQGGATDQQHYLFTFVTHPYDNVQRTVRTTIETVFVSITVKDGGAQDLLSISIGWLNTGRTFVHRQWREEEGKIEKRIIEAGEKILEKRSLHLTLPSAL